MSADAVYPTSILQTDESAKIKINLIPEYNMLRTGVRGRGSCYFHALFTDIAGRQFRSLSIKERDAYIHEYRRKLASRISLEEYTSFLEGELAKLEVFELLEENWISLVDEYFPSTVKDKFQNLFDLKSYLHQNIQSLVQIEREVQKLDKNLRESATRLLNDVLQKSYENFKIRLANPREYVDQYFTKYIDNKLGVNVILVKPDGNLYLSIQDCSEMKRNNLPVVLVYYLNETHFEAISRMNPDGTFQSYFPHNDGMIKQLFSMCP